jgi:hypothetical protein
MSSKRRTPNASATVAGIGGLSTLVAAIADVHAQCAAQATRAVNISLTFRNWLIGAHIHHYELAGADRATYGDKLLHQLAARLTAARVSNCDRRQLYRYLRFYRLYPQIAGTLSPPFAALKPPAPAQKVGAPSPQSPADAATDPLPLLTRLSYSHIEELVNLDDAAQRAFYEAEALRGHWSVRELKLERFGTAVAPLYAQVEQLARQARALRELRDALLPKLLAGELKAVECLAAECIA